MVTQELARAVDRAVGTGAEALFARLRPDGVFAPRGDRFSPANTAAAIVALHHATEQPPDRTDGPAGTDSTDSTDSTIARAVTRLCDSQRPDGGWAMAGVPTELLATAVATAALRLVAPERAAKAVRAGEELVTRLGGAAALPEPTMTGLVRQFDALSGVGKLSELPRLPMELMLLPGPARRLLSLRLPIFASMALAQAAHRPQGRARALVNRAAGRAALRVVREAYEREGSTGEFSTDPWLTSLIALGIARSGTAPDISRASAHRLRAMARQDGSWDLMPLDVTWSSFATAALLEAGYAADPRLTATRAMFHRRQQDEPFAALGCPPGFWGFSSVSSWPMALETAEVSSALLQLPGGREDIHARRGIDWLTAMQDRSGSWSLAVRGSRPGGFGPCPHMTAKAVRALLDHGVPPRDRRVVRALEWLARVQHEDGSFEAMWYRGPTPGTSVVLETLCRAGRSGSSQARRARDWLLRTQAADGSWASGEDGPDAPRGTVEETAWALHALLAAGTGPDSRAVVAAARRLTDAQCTDGSWQGAAVNEYVRRCSRYADDGIASGLALRALARLRTVAGTDGAGTGEGPPRTAQPTRPTQPTQPTRPTNPTQEDGTP
ncbi:prenyltransferase/squalene oxidase repeat-containing protein [Streptomyces ovatisporus]|uniref:Prenyltransferase/squalene oxidase repeat-containing protein n=1 Tax=Streptomyces ovatisporus TaxID=1128682 RepID=A0ABV9A9N6_9ACTN